MRREYIVLAKFAVVAAVIILVLLPSPIWAGNVIDNISMAVAYIAGTVLSAIAGKIGILVATLSNGRTAEAAQKGIKPAFLIGFRGGAVMGLLVVGLFPLRGGGGADGHRQRLDPPRLLLRRLLPRAVCQGGRRHLYQDR